MSSSTSRNANTARSDRHGNPWNLPDHLYYLLYFLARKQRRTTRAQLFQAIEDLAAKHGMLVGREGGMAEKCAMCEHPLDKNKVSRWMLRHGIWACHFCVTDLVRSREDYLSAIDRGEIPPKPSRDLAPVPRQDRRVVPFNRSGPNGERAR